MIRKLLITVATCHLSFKGTLWLLCTWECGLDEVFEELQLGLLHFALQPHLGQEGVAAAELALQVLRTAQALQLAINHHSQTSAQSLTLLHAAEEQGQRDVSTKQVHVNKFFLTNGCGE